MSDEIIKRNNAIQRGLWLLEEAKKPGLRPAWTARQRKDVQAAIRSIKPEGFKPPKPAPALPNATPLTNKQKRRIRVKAGIRITKDEYRPAKDSLRSQTLYAIKQSRKIARKAKAQSVPTSNQTAPVRRLIKRTQDS